MFSFASNLFGRKATGSDAIEREVAALEKRRSAPGTKLSAAQAISKPRAQSAAATSSKTTKLIRPARRSSKAQSRRLSATSLRCRTQSLTRRRLGDARKRLSAAKETAVREAEAVRREGAAKRVEEISSRLDGAVEIVARLFDELVAVIPASAAQVYEPGHGPRPATHYEAARQIVAEGATSPATACLNSSANAQSARRPT